MREGAGDGVRECQLLKSCRSSQFSGEGHDRPTDAVDERVQRQLLLLQAILGEEAVEEMALSMTSEELHASLSLGERCFQNSFSDFDRFKVVHQINEATKPTVLHDHHY